MLAGSDVREGELGYLSQAQTTVVAWSVFCKINMYMYYFLGKYGVA